jgi:hypothetical protein
MVRGWRKWYRQPKWREKLKWKFVQFWKWCQIREYRIWFNYTAIT